jgi:hypothetical protein
VIEKKGETFQPPPLIEASAYTSKQKNAQKNH